MHNVPLRKLKIHENIQEYYRHVFSTYEQRTKETQDLQGKVNILDKRESELEVERPILIGESSKGQEGPSAQMSIVPYTN